MFNKHSMHRSTTHSVRRSKYSVCRSASIQFLARGSLLGLGVSSWLGPQFLAWGSVRACGISSWLGDQFDVVWGSICGSLLLPKGAEVLNFHRAAADSAFLLSMCFRRRRKQHGRFSVFFMICRPTNHFLSFSNQIIIAGQNTFSFFCNQLVIF